MGIYTINEQFDSDEEKLLKAGKDKVQKQLKLKKLTIRKWMLLAAERGLR